MIEVRWCHRANADTVEGRAEHFRMARQANGTLRMKSYFLEGIASVEEAKVALREVLPGQQQPWLLRAPDGDVVAYFRVEACGEAEDPELELPAVIVDISGRHYHSDDQVLTVLRILQQTIGGRITDDQ